MSTSVTDDVIRAPPSHNRSRYDTVPASIRVKLVSLYRARDQWNGLVASASVSRAQTGGRADGRTGRDIMTGWTFDSVMPNFKCDAVRFLIGRRCRISGRIRNWKIMHSLSKNGTGRWKFAKLLLRLPDLATTQIICYPDFDIVGKSQLAIILLIWGEGGREGGPHSTICSASPY